MSFKDLFIKSDDTPQSTVVQRAETTEDVQTKSLESSSVVNSNSQTVNVSQPQQTTSAPCSISADEAIINKIWEKILAENRPGPDYLELKNNVVALDDLPISDEQKLISAFKILKKSYPNFKKEDIIEAIDFYINVVNNEKENGLNEFNNLLDSNVNNVEDEIKEMQLKSEELKQQYDELQTKIGEKTIELTKAKSDLDVKHKTFIGSIEAVMKVLNSDKEKMNSINF